MLKNKDELRALIHKHNLNRLEEQIVALAKPSVAIQRTAANDDSLPIGASKLGGSPDLPPGFEWPYTRENKPLIFIAQFRLSEIAPYDVEGILPPRGRLYFFYQADQSWYQEDDHIRRPIIYLEHEDTPLTRIPHPNYQGEEDLIVALPSQALRFEGGLTLPVIWGSPEDDYNIHFKKDDKGLEWSAYNFDLLYDAYPMTRHHLLGHPTILQGPLEPICVITKHQMKRKKFVSRNHYVFTDEEEAFIRSERLKWRFLFQIDTDDNFKVMWGLFGILFIMIPSESLEKHRFEDCWVVLQSS
jgi:uncharacterized protein YwqG